jgi:hypothetical protein
MLGLSSSITSLSCDRSIASSKLSSPKSAILRFLLQLPVSPCFLKVIQQLPFGDRLSRETSNVVVFPFAFRIAVQQPLKLLWSRLLLCDHEPSWPPTVLCFMSLLMSLLLASGEFVSEFPSPRVIHSFFPHSWPYQLGWLYQELKLPPASLSVSWVVLGTPTTSR